MRNAFVVILMLLLVPVVSGCESDSSEATYTDAAGNSCDAMVAHFGDHWSDSGLDANHVWCPASVEKAAKKDEAPTNVPAPPLLVGRERDSTLQLWERPGEMVARFDLSSCPGRGRFFVATDPRHVALVCTRAGASGNPVEAWVSLLDASGTSTVAHAGPGRVPSAPTWSPRSRSIAYAEGPADACGSLDRRIPAELWIAGTGKRERRIARLAAGGGVSLAWVEDWSPDGTVVLAVVRRYDGECRYQAHLGDTLLAVTIAGHVRSLAVGQIGRALWSPHGDNVAVTRGEGDECALELITPSGQMVASRVVADFEYVPGGCFSDGLSVAWSPNGEQILFTNGPTLFRADVDGGANTTLYSLPDQPIECGIDTPECQSMQIVDVAASGHILARVESYSDTTTHLIMIDRNGRAHRVTEANGEAVIRFAESG